MSLDWSARNVQDWDDFTDEDHVKVTVVVKEMIPVGINRITPTNWEEFYRRQLMMRVALGYSWNDLDDFSRAMDGGQFLKRVVGLSSNASGKTVTQFNKDLIANMERLVRQHRRNHEQPVKAGG